MECAWGTSSLRLATTVPKTPWAANKWSAGCLRSRLLAYAMFKASTAPLQSQFSAVYTAMDWSKTSAHLMQASLLALLAMLHYKQMWKTGRTIS